MTTFEILIKELPGEMQKIEKMTSTLAGLQSLIEMYEKHFGEKYTHGVNVVYEIARINILKRLKKQPALC